MPGNGGDASKSNISSTPNQTAIGVLSNPGSGGGAFGALCLSTLATPPGAGSNSAASQRPPSTSAAPGASGTKAINSGKGAFDALNIAGSVKPSDNTSK